MATAPLKVDDNLRLVIKTGRRYAKLTQKEAAEKSGISEIWWAQLESGIKDITTVDTVLDMLQAVKTPPRALVKAGHPDIARALEIRYDWFGADAM